MEDYKKKLKDIDTQNALEHIFRNAFGNPIIFTASPSVTDLKANTWGKYSTDIYIRFADGNGIKLGGVAF